MVTFHGKRKFRRSAGLAAALLAGTMLIPTVSRAQCDDLLPAFHPNERTGKSGTASSARGRARESLRAVTADDLVRLRDFGSADGSVTNMPAPFAVSPDGSEAAFVLSRADPQSNRYCRALVVVTLPPAGGSGQGRAKGPTTTLPRIVDRGGDYITDTVGAYDKRIENGYPAVSTPRWSPGGSSIAYLRRDDDRDSGKVQVWVARADGRGAHAITHEDADVEALAWSKDGNRVIYQVRAGTAEAERALAQEGRSGWLYDGRFWPSARLVPFVSLQPLETLSIASDGSDMRQADADEQSLVGMLDAVDHGVSSVSADGRSASIARTAENPYGPNALKVTSAGPDKDAVPPVVCSAPACRGGLSGVWWLPGGEGLVFLRREGWDKGRTAFYHWAGKAGSAPVRLWTSEDVFLGCTAFQSRLLCSRENATTPRRVTLIDMQTGKVSDVFDPNPEFAKISLGKVERLYWRNNLGLEVRGDLVLPPDYRKGTRLPLVVVQYNSNGFLRGGTGDEYPIHALAAKGIAVLSIERPAPVVSLHPEVKTPDQMLSVFHKDWAERKSMQSAIEVGVKAAIDRGIADPQRLGITGLSDGSSAVRFALINSNLFKVASISTCCVDENALIYNGPAVQRQFEAMGYAGPGGNLEFWKPYSLALNAGRMNRPLLMQLAEDEYVAGLNTFTVLRSAGQPVEMFVFPGDHHRKWQPAHRAAVYARNLDWFQFWLQDKEDPDPAKQPQYKRWEAMRDRLRSRP